MREIGGKGQKTTSAGANCDKVNIDIFNYERLYADVSKSSYSSPKGFIAAQVITASSSQACLPCLEPMHGRQADRHTERAVDGVISTFLKIPKVIPLGSLLDAYSRSNNSRISNEPDVVVDHELKEELRRKRRRGMRR